MKSYASHRDSAFSIMAMDILGNVLKRADDPGDLGTYLTEEVRELTGAHCVLLIECQPPAAEAACRVVSINPLRRRKWAESPVANQLYEVAHHVPAARFWRGEEPSEAANFLRKEGFELSMVFPLPIGEFRMGTMLVLGLPDEQHVTSLLSLLGNLSATVALVLRNALLFKKQEQIIQERTAELRENNEKLAMELTEHKRAEEAVTKLNEELDQRVKERTAELETKNHELEQILKAFVGRELRMVELKEQVRRLEARVVGGAKFAD